MRALSARVPTVAVAAAALLLASGAAAPDHRPDPIAVIVRVAGAVQLQRADAPAPVAATVGASLQAGDRVLVERDGRAALLLRTGRKLTVTEPIVVQEPDEAEQAGTFSRAIRTLTEVATTDAGEHPNRQGMIRPVPGEPAPIAPRNGIRVLDVRPTFVWFDLPDTERYRIQIRRADGGRPLRYEAGSDTTWTLPASAPPLVPGARYEWTVGPAGSGRVAPLQRFEVIGGTDYDALARALRQLDDAGLAPDGDGRFLAALAYREAGLFYEAERVLDELAEAGDAAGPRFHRLRGEVYDALGRLEAAGRAFGRADAGGENDGGGR